MQASAVFGDVVFGEDDEVVWNLVHGGLALLGESGYLKRMCWVGTRFLFEVKRQAGFQRGKQFFGLCFAFLQGL